MFWRTTALDRTLAFGRIVAEAKKVTSQIGSPTCVTPRLGFCMVSSQIRYSGLQLPGPNTAALTLVNGGLMSRVRFEDPQLRLRVNGELVGNPFDTTGNVNIDFVEIDLVFDAGFDGAGRPNLSIRPGSVAVRVGGITFNGQLNSVVVGLVSSLANGLIRDIVRSTLGDFVQNRFTDILDGLMSGLDVQTVAPRFEVSRLNGAAPLAVVFGTNFSSINTNATRLLTTLGTQFQSAPGHARPTLGAPIPSGPRFLDPGTAGRPVASSLHVGLLDQRLHALWRGAYFDAALGAGALNGVIPAGAALTLATALPPTATLRGDGRVEVALGAVNVHLEHPALLAQPVDGHAGGRISCAGRLDGDDLRLEDCTVDELHLSTRNVLDAQTGALLEQLMANVLRSVLSIAANDGLPALPIPGFPIPAQLGPYGLPVGGVLGIVNPTISSAGSHVVVRGNLGVQ